MRMTQMVMSRQWMAVSSALPIALCACHMEADDEEEVGQAELAVIDLDVPWERHIIAEGSAALKGSDGVHLADINGDGRLDATTAYEQSHKVSVSLHPGYDQADDAEWPSKVVLPSGTGRILGPEDAIFADVDGDGRKDVIVGAQSDNRVTVLFAPADLINGAWPRMDLLVGTKVMRVAFANVAGGGGPTAQGEIVVGGREVPNAAAIGYYELTTPASPRLASSWTYRFVKRVSWIMQMVVIDMEGDNRRDIVYTDRVSMNVAPADPTARGLRWLKSSSNMTPSWEPFQIGLVEGDHKWFDIVKWDADNDFDIADCRSGATVEQYRLWLNNGGGLTWNALVVPEPAAVGECQHITFANIDNAGALDLGISYSHADGLSGVVWLQNTGTAAAPVWQRGEISGSGPGDGIKFDNLVWYDMDGDGDLDAVTSEQHEGPQEPDPVPPAGPGLGIIWYENPLIAAG
jgi:hypothetical protein